MEIFLALMLTVVPVRESRVSHASQPILPRPFTGSWGEYELHQVGREVVMLSDDWCARYWVDGTGTMLVHWVSDSGSQAMGTYRPHGAALSGHWWYMHAPDVVWPHVMRRSKR